jgi:two-component system nitrogen regulation sensor histidine kinase GlnL
MSRKAGKGAVLRQSPQHAGHFGDGVWIAAEALATAVILVDGRARIIRCNPAAEMLFGLSGRALAGTDLTALIDGLKGWFAAPEVKIAQGVPCSLVTELSTPLQAARHVFVTATSAEEPGRYLVEVSDTHEALERFREEHQSDLSGAARGMLRNLAHEIKNPLGGIRGAAQLLELELESPQLREYTDVIIHETDRLLALLDRMLTPYRAERRVQEINIHEVLERVKNLVLAEYGKGLEIERDYDVSLPEIMGDGEQLIQVFLNLARNAAQALGDKISSGTARIRFQTRIARLVTIRRNRYRLALSVLVEDNGPGIPAELRERIFYPLVTGRADGTGLGLALVKNYVEQHGGAIEVQSSPGKTQFRVLLPIGAPIGGEQVKEEAL